MIDQFIKTWIFGGAVNKDRLRITDADEFIRPFLKAFPVDELSRVAAYGADDAGVST